MAKGKANGTAYTKYVKVQSGPHGAASCIRYINDKNKTMEDTLQTRRARPGEDEFTGGDNASDGNDALIDYMIDETKTISPDSYNRLVSGHNCSVSTAKKEFSIAERAYHAKHDENLRDGYKANQAFHIIVSYKGDDLDPRFVHKLGCEFARRVCGDAYQAVVATHLNTGNYHNHICVNAYPIKGDNKFRDGLYAYKGFRSIADDLSLEYGLPINIGDEKSKTRSKPWAEFIKSAEGKSWKQDIIDDLDKAIEASTNYNEVLSVMERLGYQVQHNTKSVTFSKGEGRIRDNRLGRQYTCEGIEEHYEKQKEKEERKEAMAEIQEQRRRREQQNIGAKRKPRRVYVPYYNNNGRRLSFLERYILLVKAMVGQIMDGYYDAGSNAKFPENERFWPAHKKLEMLDQTMALAEKCGGLDLRDLYRERKQLQNAADADEAYLNNAADVLKDISQFRAMVSAVTALGFDYSAIANHVDVSEIQAALSELEPMTSRTRSVLYQTIHDSEYRLTCKFNELTETQAQDIIQAIREGRRDHLPEQVRHQSDRTKHAAPQADPRPRLDLSRIDSADKQKLMEFKTIADRLAKYGIRTLQDAEKFLSANNTHTESLARNRQSLVGVEAQIKDVRRLQNQMEKISSAAFVYGPLYAGNAEEFNLSLDALQSGQRIDQLNTLNDALRNLQYVPISQLSKMNIPIPEDYILAKKLQEIIPAAFTGTDMSSPISVRMALEDIQSNGTVAELIAAETAKEQAEQKAHERENDRCERNGRQANRH